MPDTDLDRIVAFVQRYAGENGFPPSYAEIAEACGLGSVGHVQYRVNLLVREGRLVRTPGRARSLQVVAGKVDERPRCGGEHNRIKRQGARLFEAVAGFVRRRPRRR